METVHFTSRHMLATRVGVGTFEQYKTSKGSCSVWTAQAPISAYQDSSEVARAAKIDSLPECRWIKLYKQDQTGMWMQMYWYCNHLHGIVMSRNAFVWHGNVCRGRCTFCLPLTPRPRCEHQPSPTEPCPSCGRTGKMGVLQMAKIHDRTPTNKQHRLGMW